MTDQLRDQIEAVLLRRGVDDDHAYGIAPDLLPVVRAEVDRAVTQALREKDREWTALLADGIAYGRGDLTSEELRERGRTRAAAGESARADLAAYTGADEEQS